MVIGAPFVWPHGTFVVLAMTVLYASAALIAIAWTQRRSHRSKLSLDRSMPMVTVLKPLRGFDDALEDNLESFAHLRYPNYEIIFATRSADDPALEVARLIAARNRHCRIRILAGVDGDAANPKVLLLEAMLQHARGQLLLISDSNVRIERDDLTDLVQPMSDDTVGMVYQPVVGVGERTAAAAMENSRFTEQGSMGMIFAKRLAGVDAAVGKGILLRREALGSIDDFRRLRDVLAEDYLLGVEMRRAGWRCVLSHTPVQAVHVDWSLRALLSRHLRHSSMRFRLSPWTYPIEAVTNLTLIGTLPVFLSGWTGLVVFAAAAGIKTLLDAVVLYSARGSWPKARYLLLLPIKDLLMAGVWLAGIFNSQVHWRGVSYRIGMGTRLVPLGMPGDDEPAILRMPQPAQRRRAA
ncbi:MAG TPA: glycosyltransferase [Pirellulales bacterium]|nr:glycosyltransferase [Pirellulales bacterium]